MNRNRSRDYGGASPLRAAAAAELEASRAARAHDAGEHATRLAVDIASKLLDRLSDGVRVAGFIDGLAEGQAQRAEREQALGLELLPVHGSLFRAAREMHAGQPSSIESANPRRPSILCRMRIASMLTVIREDFMRKPWINHRPYGQIAAKRVGFCAPLPFMSRLAGSAQKDERVAEAQARPAA